MLLHSVINATETILVTREGDNFLIMDLENKITISINSKNFYGNLFKYENEFLRKFKDAVAPKEVTNILISCEAADFISNLLYFNGVDN